MQAKWLILLWSLVLCLGLQGVQAQAKPDWDDVDYEIFDLNDALKKLRGPEADFYSVFSVGKDASLPELVRAYRKTSLEYHPDKNDSKEAAKLYALLTSISDILKTPEKRGKYDGHLKRGFPVWKGSGYYYRKFKPGVGFVVFVIVVFISVVQYLSAWGIYYMNIYVAKTQHEELVEAQKKKKKGSIEPIPELNLNFPKPSIAKVAIFQLPVLVFSLVLKPFTKKPISEMPEDDQPVVVSRTPKKISKRKLKRGDFSDVDPNFIE